MAAKQSFFRGLKVGVAALTEQNDIKEFVVIQKIFVKCEVHIIRRSLIAKLSLF